MTNRIRTFSTPLPPSRLPLAAKPQTPDWKQEYLGEFMPVPCTLERRIELDLARGVHTSAKAKLFVRSRCPCAKCRDTRPYVEELPERFSTLLANRERVRVKLREMLDARAAAGLCIRCGVVPAEVVEPEPPYQVASTKTCKPCCLAWRENNKAKRREAANQ